jgi:hypothetical protein
MSDKRLLELGIPRRGFLKKTATVAFVAPVVASFSLDGIAEAGSGSFSNQCFSNQYYSNQTLGHVETNLMSMLDEILTALNLRRVGAGPATSLAQQVLRVLLEVAGGQPSSACDTLQHIVAELHDQQGKLPTDLYNGLLTKATAVQTSLRCVCP